MKKIALFLCCLTASFFLQSQGLEQVFVETYYVSDSNDAGDSDGGSLLESGSTTYRVYVDMAPGFELETVFGSSDHDAFISTTTEFYNNADRGQQIGSEIDAGRLDENTVALDSWVSLGGASDEHWGIPKSLDVDGSIVGGVNNDGGSEGVAGGLLVNAATAAGIPLTTQDGLLSMTPPDVATLGLDLSMFDDENSPNMFFTNDGAWAVLGGTPGVTADNIVCIAQITTTGDLAFELNIRISNMAGTIEQYVANNPIITQDGIQELVAPGLTYPSTSVAPDPRLVMADPSTGDVVISNLGDGTMDISSYVLCNFPAYQVLSGVTPTSGDYNLDPGESVTVNWPALSGADGELGLYTMSSFTNPDAMRDYFQWGTAAHMRESVAVAAGIWTAGEFQSDAPPYSFTGATGQYGLPFWTGTSSVPGCTDPEACNFDSEATEDDGSCLVPNIECEECSDGAVVQIDLDMNGIGDCDEVFGCTDPDACNFDPEVNVDDGSCVVVSSSQISSDDPLEICAGDGIADPIAVTLIAGDGPVSTYVVTDENVNILAIQDGSDFDLEGAGVGTCLIWHITYDDTNLTGLTVGKHFAAGRGCYAQSNSISVVRNGGGCTDVNATNYNAEACFDDGSCITGDIPGCTDPAACNFNEVATTDDGSCVVLIPSTISTGDVLEICVGDGMDDIIEVEVSGGQGPDETFVITDLDGIILDIAAGPSFNLEGVAEGTCLIWHMNFDATDISGADVGSSATMISGCFTFSNSLEVIRSTGGCTDVTATNYSESACFDDGSCVFDIILGCTNPEACNYNAEATEDDGSCILVSAATISTDDATDICAGDGIPDPINVTVTGGDSPDAVFVITDASLEILALEAGPVIDLEGAGAGTCLIWYLSYDATDITGAEIGMNAADLSGCFILSNEITVVRAGGGCTDETANNFDPEACFDDGTCEFEPVDGCTDEAACNYNPAATVDDGSCVILVAGTITTKSPTEICSGDGLDDVVNVDLVGGQGPNSIYVVTDTDLNVINATASSTLSVDDTGVDTCLVWHMWYDTNLLTGANLGANVADDFVGCYILSNAITIIKQTGGCTDPTAANFDEDACFDDGSCEFSEGCTDLNACNYDEEATIDDGSCIVVEASVISTTSPTEVCTGDGIDDPVSVSSDGGQGPAQIFVITNEALDILDLSTIPEFDFEAAGIGECVIWELHFDPNDVTGTDIGANAADLSGCFALSNGITIVRSGGGCTDPEADNYNEAACFDDESCEYTIIPGCMDETACNYNPEANEDDGSCVFISPSTIATDDPTVICAGDGIADPINVTVTGGSAPNMAFVITDADLNILAIEDGPTFDLEGAGEGLCLIWHLNFDAANISGADVGANAADLAGCFILSNEIAVTRNGGGCTDPTAENYDEDACFDDESCVYEPIPGCTNPAACNHESHIRR